MPKSKKGKPKKKSAALVLARKHPQLVEELIAYGRSLNGVVGICRSLAPIAPDNMRVVLSYGFNVSITTSAGEVETYVFTGNGLFDPDVTGAGAQPMGFDQWHGIYNKHRCLASSIEMDVTTPDAATNDAQVFESVLFPNVVNVQPTSTAAARCMPYAVAKACIGTFQTGNPRFKSVMATNEIMGISPLALVTEDTLGGTSSANAADLWYWVLMTQVTDQASATVFRIVGTIHYLVDFYDRNLASLSVQGSVDKKGKRKSLH